MAFLSWLIETLLQWYVWLPIVLTLAYLTWRNYQQVDAVKSVESILLAIEIPKANEKKEGAAEHLFAGLHDILRDSGELRKNGGIQEHMSFEIVSADDQIKFYVWVPKSLQSFIESQIYAQYPGITITEAQQDYIAHERRHSVVYTSELSVTDNEYLPIKTYESFEVDPLTSLVSSLAKVDSKSEEFWIQILARPISDDWHKNTQSWINTVKNGNPLGFLIDGQGFDAQWLFGLFGALWKPPQGGGPNAQRALTDRDKNRIAGAEKKSAKPGYKVRIRLVYLGASQTNAKLRTQAVVGTFKQFSNSGLNGFKLSSTSFNKEDLSRYKARLFMGGGYILNIEELASIFHLPHAGTEAPKVAWATVPKAAEPPSKLPLITGNQAIDENISAFGQTQLHGINHQFGLLRTDRTRHVYIIGQTGAGKTATLELLALSDIYHNQGYAIIDPHGDFAMSNLRFIPGTRLQDVVYFNPADTAYPLGFNPLEISDPSQKSIASSEVIGVLKRMFGDSWGPRLEYILRYTILALLDRPAPTMLDITRMLTDKNFRADTLSYCQDPVVLQFWNVEFKSWSEKFQSEAIAPVLNKVGAFTANPVIRNIIGQPRSTFNIREMMDNGKILIVNLSKGLIGEDNANILGAFLVTKIQLAAMSRSDIPDINDRKPFYLYVDEFQNFATDSFATILSEARKYGLCLTVANQYVSQMNETVRGSVFGNVGTMVSFRVSAEDAPLLVKQFEPQFTPTDLLQMHNRQCVISMVVSGEKVPAFMATTLTLPPPQNDNTGRIIQNTREHYSRNRGEVEASHHLATPVQKQPVTISQPGPVMTPQQSVAAPATAQAAQAAMQAPVEQTPPRKRRARSRKKKTAVTPAAPAPTQAPLPAVPVAAPAPARVSVLHDPTKLRIHHSNTPKPKSAPKPAHEAVKAEPKPAAVPQPKKHDETILRVR